MQIKNNKTFLSAFSAEHKTHFYPFNFNFKRTNYTLSLITRRTTASNTCRISRL